ncbi:hypothetical protein L596_009587 [Steinernema carpocapsae]|uniref:Uncharacterized protein n=1 Tax=Steinernema carpocapsae TaxID=34508 RepID=A0A4U5PGA4_STECR|nr:hypothetical protein L596_009587 [Steinernema carpocapsae]
MIWAKRSPTEPSSQPSLSVCRSEGDWLVGGCSVLSSALANSETSAHDEEGYITQISPRSRRPCQTCQTCRCRSTKAARSMWTSSSRSSCVWAVLTREWALPSRNRTCMRC